MVRPGLCSLAGALLLIWLPLEGQVSGRVVVGGGPPPAPAFVTVDCGGLWEGFTDKRGEFIASFPHGRQMLTGPASSNPNGGQVSTDPAFSCTVEATLPGYTRGITHANRVSASDVVIVTLYPLGGRDDSTVSYQDLAVPVEARKQFEKGEFELRERKWKSAQASLRKAIALYPDYALAWARLGEALEGSHKLAEAGSAYAKAISMNARFFSVYVRWAVIDASQERWEQVAATTGAAIKLDPSTGRPFSFTTPWQISISGG